MNTTLPLRVPAQNIVARDAASLAAESGNYTRLRTSRQSRIHPHRQIKRIRLDFEGGRLEYELSREFAARY